MKVYFYNPFRDGIDFSLRFGLDYSIKFKYIDFVFDFIFVQVRYYKEFK
jgi:hypothetical protein